MGLAFLRATSVPALVPALEAQVDQARLKAHSNLVIPCGDTLL